MIGVLIFYLIGSFLTYGRGRSLKNAFYKAGHEDMNQFFNLPYLALLSWAGFVYITIAFIFFDKELINSKGKFLEFKKNN